MPNKNGQVPFEISTPAEITFIIRDVIFSSLKEADKFSKIATGGSRWSDMR